MSEKSTSLDERIATLEQAVAELQQQVSDSKFKVPRSSNWVEAISGSMEDFPEFEKVLEYGRQIRREQLAP